MTILTEPTPVISRTSDADDPPAVSFRSGLITPVRSGSATDRTEPSTFTYSKSTDIAAKRVSRTFLEHLVEEYIAIAMRHIRKRQMPDGFWIADVVGLEGAWSDGTTEDEAAASLPDIIFDWAMLKIADEDGDIPALASIDLNLYRL